jgi:toxin ParE1/3/4
MNYSVTVAEAAENDIRQAFLWYEDQKENLGTIFQEHINKAIDSIHNNPLKVQIRYSNTRVYFLNKFPFGIHFQVNETQILIVAAFHTSQNPKLWSTR